MYLFFVEGGVPNSKYDHLGLSQNRGNPPNMAGFLLDSL